MTDAVENLMLEHLKRFQATLEKLDTRIGELTIRQTETYTAVLGLHRDQLNDAEMSAHLQVQMDRFGGRLDRIERRLELTN